MSPTKKIFILVLLWGVVPTSAGAATYFVDGTLSSDCLEGNYDTANRDCSGTDGVALNTINEAVSRINSGDTILVRGGTYAEKVTYDSARPREACF